MYAVLDCLVCTLPCGYFHWRSENVHRVEHCMHQSCRIRGYWFVNAMLDEVVSVCTCTIPTEERTAEIVYGKKCRLPCTFVFFLGEINSQLIC